MYSKEIKLHFKDISDGPNLSPDAQNISNFCLDVQNQHFSLRTPNFVLKKVHNKTNNT